MQDRVGNEVDKSGKRTNLNLYNSFQRIKSLSGNVENLSKLVTTSHFFSQSFKTTSINSWYRLSKRITECHDSPQ